jgi:hypothetical protein
MDLDSREKDHASKEEPATDISQSASPPNGRKVEAWGNPDCSIQE